MNGFIYVLENESMPGLVKIGKTARGPNDRAVELYTSGVPTPFSVVFAVYCEDVDRIESEIHDDLSEHRVNDSREFFRLDREEAVKSVLGNTLSGFDLSVIPAELEIDGGSLALFCHKSGFDHPFHIPAILDFISDDAWLSAATRYREKLQRIQQRQLAKAEQNGDG